VREVDRDVSFLRRWLTEPIMQDLDLFQYESKGDDLVVTRVSNDDGWRDVKNTLLQNIGMGTTPVIRITDADFGGNRILHLVHEHEGRDLLVEYAEKTLLHLHTLWGREVALETVINGKRMILGYGEQGFSSRAP
jgi:stage V sporulation protein R